MNQPTRRLGEVVNINIDETVVSCIIIAIESSYTLCRGEYRMCPTAGYDSFGSCFITVKIDEESLSYFGHGFAFLQYCCQLLVGDRKMWYEPNEFSSLR